MQALKSQNIILTPIQEEDIELLRNWRNAPQISNNMEFRGYISPEDQKQWFKSLNTEINYYFIVNYRQRKIGLIHLNKFDSANASAHAGLFIAEKEFTGTGISLGASLLILTFGFSVLNLKNIYAKIKHNNNLALQYNTGLGFVFEEYLNNDFSLYKLSKETFEQKKAGLEKLAQVI